MKITYATYFTLSRIVLTPCIIVLLIQSLWTSALMVFLVAMFTDVCDGFIARRFNQESCIGQLLDPVADKILLSGVLYTLLCLLPFFSLIKYGVLFLLCKECILISGGAWLWYRQHLFIAPSFLSRLVSFCEMLLVVILLGQKVFSLPISFAMLFILLLINIMVSAVLLVRYARILWSLKKESL